MAGTAECGAQLAVHMDQVLAAGALVQVIHVLRNQRDGSRKRPLEPRQRIVGRIWSYVMELATALVVEVVDTGRVRSEGVWRCIVAPVEPGPDAVAVAEAGDPGFNRDACSGEDDDR